MHSTCMNVCTLTKQQVLCKCSVEYKYWSNDCTGKRISIFFHNVNKVIKLNVNPRLFVTMNQVMPVEIFSTHIYMIETYIRLGSLYIILRHSLIFQIDTKIKINSGILVRKGWKSFLNDRLRRSDLLMSVKYWSLSRCIKTVLIH